MKPALKVLILLIVVLLITNIVISDKLDFEFNSTNSDIIMHIGSPTNPDSDVPIEIDLKLIALLFCVGIIGITVFARRRTSEITYDDDDKSALQ